MYELNKAKRPPGEALRTASILVGFRRHLYGSVCHPYAGGRLEEAGGGQRRAEEGSGGEGRKCRKNVFSKNARNRCPRPLGASAASGGLWGPLGGPLGGPGGPQEGPPGPLALFPYSPSVECNTTRRSAAAVGPAGPGLTFGPQTTVQDEELLIMNVELCACNTKSEFVLLWIEGHASDTRKMRFAPPCSAAHHTRKEGGNRGREGPRP